jgi:molybdate transport system substrate-binding protein
VVKSISLLTEKEVVMKSFVFLILVVFSQFTYAETIRVAVANNFYGPLKALAQDYNEYSANELLISTGSTGQLFAQISNGAPYDVFLSADSERPKKLVEAGLAHLPFTYAQGRLVLWSSDSNLLVNDEKALDNNQIKHLGIPNPKLAPYGYAALQVMKNTHTLDTLQPRLVEGKNLSVVYQYVTTGNAQAGFLSMSQIYKSGVFIEGSHWVIPVELYDSINQDAVVLSPAMDNQAAIDFINYLKTSRAKSIMYDFGYR